MMKRKELLGGLYNHVLWLNPEDMDCQEKLIRLEYIGILSDSLRDPEEALQEEADLEAELLTLRDDAKDNPEYHGFFEKQVEEFIKDFGLSRPWVWPIANRARQILTAGAVQISALDTVYKTTSSLINVDRLKYIANGGITINPTKDDKKAMIMALGLISKTDRTLWDLGKQSEIVHEIWEEETELIQPQINLSLDLYLYFEVTEYCMPFSK